MMRRIAGLLAAAVIGGSGAVAIAQSGETAANTAEQLGLPDQFVVFGERDPNIRKPTAIVNGEIITRTDVDQRLALVLASNPGAQIGEEEQNRLRMQVLRNLIDETLQIQEARANEISITQAEIDAAFAEVARRSNSTPEAFSAFLRSVDTSDRSMKRQILGELAWNRLLRRNINPFVNVAESEVEAFIQRREAARGQSEYHVAEIYVSARPDNEAEVLAGMEQILEQIRQGASFQAYARQFSEASTAAVGGDLGWIRPEQLPAELARVIPQMPVGGISRPIAVPGGFSIIAVIESRQVLTASPLDAMLSLKQITVTFPPGTTREQAEPIVSRFAAATQQGGGCGAAEGIASQLGGDVVQNDQVRLGDLPAALQQAMTNLQVGEASPPFGSLEEGVRVLVLCGRDDPPAVTQLDPQQIEDTIAQERVNRQARAYLRDLRRNAVIEYR